MSRLVGRVHFNATLDGRKIPDEARAAGKQAGLSGGKAFGEQWDKEFQKTLTQKGQKTLEHWQRRGELDGLTYGRGLEVEFAKFTRRLSSAFDNFQGLSVNASFMDDFIGKSDDWEVRVGELYDQLALLSNQGGITDAQFRASTATIDRWASAQLDAAQDAAALSAEQERQERALSDLSAELSQHAQARQNVLRVEREHERSLINVNREWERSEGVLADLDRAFDRVINSSDGLNLSWSDLSHNGRQWTLIIGAITAALPELAGLSSAAGSGLLALGGAATSGFIGIGATISAIVGLNGDIEKLPPSLRDARAGLDDFKESFSDLNAVITSRAFEDSEASWRSLGNTVRGLRPAFGEVGDSVGKVLDGLAEGLAPGTRNFENLSNVVAASADDFEQLAGIAGRLGEGLLAAFSNPEMQRSVDELLGWLESLSDGFADFAEGDEFDDWLRHGRAVFGEFGELLGTTTSLLNDLVTPESITRLTDFMDNLGTFLDTGGRGILEFADELNAFGLIAQVLADLGEALEPIREPVAEIAEEFSRLASGGIDGIAGTLSVVATAAAPVAEAFGEILSNIPTDALVVLGGVAAGTAGAFALLKGAQGIQGALFAIQGISTDGEKAVGVLGRLGAAAALVGAGVVGITALHDASESFFEDLRGYDTNANNIIGTTTSLQDAWSQLGGSALGASFDMDAMSGALDQVGDIGGDLDQFFPSLGALFTETGRQAGGLAEVLSTLSPKLADLAGSDVQAATTQFAAWAAELNATDQQVLNMLEAMPEFRDVLESVALQSGGAATDQDVLALALGRTDTAARASGEALTEMGEKAGLSKEQVDSLADAIRGFGETTLSSRDAERQFEQAIDDLTQSVADNGTQLDINSEKGRANEAALDAIAQKALIAAATKLELTGSEEKAAAAIDRGRDALIEQLAQFGITGAEAEAYADDLGLIPDDVYTAVDFDDANARARMENFIARLNSIPRSRTVTIGAVTGGLGSLPLTATGGLFNGAQARIIGEAGVEAVVPMDRPLDQVDPDVRWLSAIAQGKADKMGGGFGSSGKQVTVEAGAIVVQGSPNQIATSVEILDQLAQNI